MLYSLAFNAMGGNNVIVFLTRQHRIDELHIETEGRCLARSDAFSGGTHSASRDWKENDETQTDERKLF